MIKRLFICIQFILFGCGQTDCPQGINKLPMYGRLKKCKQQLDLDQDFIKETNGQFRSRSEGAKFYIERGWGYYYRNQLDTAMMRFNQAWLLDSSNADIYWGYGNIAGINKNFKGSLIYLEKSLQMNPANPRVWESASTSYGQLFYESKDINLLNTSIKYLKTSIKLEPNNARAYGQLTSACSYFVQKDSARKYLKITDSLDAGAINPEVRKIVSAN